jgi:hypothetical protein
MKKSLVNLLEENKLRCGRMIAGSKRSPEGQLCIWNANIITRTEGKVWYGDLNLTKEGNLLKQIAKEYGEPLYVLREMDCRFESETGVISTLISKAVWSTDKI